MTWLKYYFLRHVRRNFHDWQCHIIIHELFRLEISYICRMTNLKFPTIFSGRSYLFSAYDSNWILQHMRKSNHSYIVNFFHSWNYHIFQSRDCCWFHRFIIMTIMAVYFKEKSVHMNPIRRCRLNSPRSSISPTTVSFSAVHQMVVTFDGWDEICKCTNWGPFY